MRVSNFFREFQAIRLNGHLRTGGVAQNHGPAKKPEIYLSMRLYDNIYHMNQIGH